MKKKLFIFLLFISIIIIAFSIYFWKYKNFKVDLKTIKDNGDWVFIINDEIISKTDFELYYSFFIKLFSLESGISEKQFYLKDQTKMKNLALEKFIENELIFNKASDYPFFKNPEGKSIIENIYKESLSQFFLYKNVFSKIGDLENVSDDILESFYNDLTLQYPPHELKNLKEKGIYYSKNNDNTQLKNFYKTTMTSTKMKKIQDQLVLESSISKNTDIFFKYIDGSLKKEEIEKNPEKYWIFNINDNKIFLSEYIHIIDYQLNIFLKNKKNTDSKSSEQFKNMLLEKFKYLELTYRKALMENYSNLDDAKIFIRFLKNKEIANIYLIKNILSDLIIEKKVVNDFIKNKENKEKIYLFLKRHGYKNIDSSDYLIGAESYLKQYELEKRKTQFVNNLKEEYFVRVSEKYFEQKSSKIQNEILNK